MRIFKCWTCNGEGGWTDYVEIWELPYQECPHCKGTGKWGFIEWFWYYAPVWFVEWVGDMFYKEGE